MNEPICKRCYGYDREGKPRDGRVIAYVCSTLADGSTLKQRACLDCANDARAQMLHSKRGVPGEFHIEIIKIGLANDSAL